MKKQYVLIAALIFLILSFFFDKQILAVIQSLRHPFLDSFFSTILFIEKDFIFYPMIIVLTISFLFLLKRKQAILPFIISMGISALFSYLLKISILRQRPFSTELNSFPSGHATIAFTPLPFLSKGIAIVWLVFACLLAFTRLWFGLHYLSDVIAGAILGYGIALIIKKIIKK